MKRYAVCSSERPWSGVLRESRHSCRWVFIEPCQRTVTKKAPSGASWIHEIKHDGYRLIVRKDGGRARMFTRRGFEWTDRYPAIGVVK